MNRLCRNRRGCFFAFLGAGGMVLFSLSAQNALPPMPASALSNSIPSAPPAAPPLPPMAKPPVEFFRELLATNFLGRIRLLSTRPPATRSAILAKVHEYENMQPEDRELRLKATELQWWIMPLLPLPVTNRDDYLSRIPTNDLKLVKDRLMQWDALSAEEQKEFLADKDALNMIVEPNSDAQTPPMARMKQARVEAGNRRLEAMTEEERAKAVATYTSLFRIQEAEKDKILRTLSEQEKGQIEKTLEAFNGLTGPRRALCIHSFEKFTCLSPEERQQFLKNAERWELMSPSERQKWRELVQKWTRMPPPLPRSLPPRPDMAQRPALIIADTNHPANGE
jgi:hypothetical protein